MIPRPCGCVLIALQVDGGTVCLNFFYLLYHKQAEGTVQPSETCAVQVRLVLCRAPCSSPTTSGQFTSMSR